LQRLAPSVPMPRRTAETQPFWDGCSQGKLLISRCAGCGQHHFSRLAACPKCYSTTLEWVESRGRGRLHSYVICHSSISGSHEQTPSIIAIIQLDEGPQIMSLLTGLEQGHEKLKVGIPVEVVFDSASNRGECAFSFRPASCLERR
jgi:uncharacterized OB-fold protein